MKKFTDKIELFETTKPDIVFEINGKKYAIEIETGKIYKRDKKKLQNKIKNLKKEYGNNWFFVVTDRNFYPFYKKFGETYTKLSVANKILQAFKK